ncbi:hypothetical protein V1527DRAFT_326593 [Lipomyces starkeyi]
MALPPRPRQPQQPPPPPPPATTTALFQTVQQFHTLVNSITSFTPDSFAKQEEEVLYTVDDLVRSRARSFPNTNVLAYVANDSSRTDYTHYTAANLHRFADETARKYLQAGIVKMAPREIPVPSVVGMLAPSDMSYVATMHGRVRLGYTVLMLSNRLSVDAIVSLVKATSCKAVIHGRTFVPMLDRVVAAVPTLGRIEILSRSEWDILTPSGPPSEWHAHTPADSEKNVFIIHSSGSTGLPKPIFQSHKAAINNYATSFDMKGLITLPLYHNHGISSYFRSLYACNEIYFYNAKLPLTRNILVDVMEAVKCEIFYGVPYALKLLGEHESGINVLKTFKLVLFGGSSCPDDLGDRLVEAGVNLVGHYGSTETGQLMTSFRPKGDKAWNYLRVNPTVAPYLLMERTSPTSDVYECVCLDGWKSKVVSNSNGPPNSFRTKDLFSPHPTIPSAWKYLGRVDDRVTLVNGEKVLPIPIEHRIREDPHVKECIVVGVGKTAPGLIIIPSEDNTCMSPEQIIDAIWTAIEDANGRAEAFSQISRELVMVLPSDVDYPRTDKGTIIRSAFYKRFEHEIDALFQRFSEGDEGDLVLDGKGLEKFVYDVFVNTIGIKLEDLFSDFFSFGVDSLQALRVWSILRRSLDLGGNGSKLSQNVVFEHPNCKVLARHLYTLGAGVESAKDDDIEILQQLYVKYSNFRPHVCGTARPSGEHIIITGTTGSLGAHALVQAAQLAHVKKVYCLVRASSTEDALSRVISGLKRLELTLAPEYVAKIVAYPSDFSRPDLGLPSDVYNNLLSTLTTVIHSAWAVNFNIGIKSFEQYHINGTHNLLQFCLDVKTISPAAFYFCSSISTAAGTPIPATIAESPVVKFEHAQNMGYAKSKLITEHIVERASEKCGLHARVIRIGQIVGDSVNGYWNDTEAIPLMIRSALTLKALPALEETPSWLPVDYVARSLMELCGLVNPIPSDRPQTVYHVLNPKTFRWTEDLLPALHSAGLDFRIVKQREWIRLLREGDQDPIRNPTVKLSGFFAAKYDNDRPGRQGLVFETHVTEKNSDAIRNATDPVSSGLIKKFLERWLEMWV